MSKVVWITLLVCGIIVCIVTGSLWLSFRFAKKRPQDPIPKIPWYIITLFFIGLIHIIVGVGLGIYEWHGNKERIEPSTVTSVKMQSITTEVQPPAQSPAQSPTPALRQVVAPLNNVSNSKQNQSISPYERRSMEYDLKLPSLIKSGTFGQVPSHQLKQPNDLESNTRVYNSYGNTSLNRLNPLR
jgi:hypothetical protein